MNDPYNLHRFLGAQDAVYASVLKELEQGQKTSHWMWFVFPQIAGLGFSPVARKFSIHSIAEARRYLEHPILGKRLLDCTALVNRIKGQSIHQIFGSPDDMKFRSCMTLFTTVAEVNIFADALIKYFGGAADDKTLHILENLDDTV